MNRYNRLLILTLMFGISAACAQTLLTGSTMNLASSGYLKAANFANVGTGDFTIEGWVKTSGTGAFVSNRDCGSHGNFFTFYVGSTLSLEIDEDESATNYATPAGTTSVANGAWHHVAMVRSGTTVKFYIDGALDATVTTSGVANINNAYPLFVGARGTGSGGIGDYLVGSVDDIRIWDVARTAGEIAANKDAYINASTPNLMANYRFDESSGTTTADATTNAHDLTLFGGAQFSNSPLPVEMAGFSAMRTGARVTLRWSTATEVNNSGFSVEKNVEGKSEKEKGNSAVWTEIGFVAGHGTTNAPKSYSFTDASALGSVRYRLKQVDNDGAVHYSSIVEASSSAVPSELFLGQNYPNPFNPSTTISFSVPVTGHASVKVYDAVGREVATLFDGIAEAGVYQTTLFDASRLASGIYVARLTSGGSIQMKKMVLMK